MVRVGCRAARRSLTTSRSTLRAGGASAACSGDDDATEAAIVPFGTWRRMRTEGDKACGWTGCRSISAGSSCAIVRAASCCAISSCSASGGSTKGSSTGSSSSGSTVGCSTAVDCCCGRHRSYQSRIFATRRDEPTMMALTLRRNPRTTVKAIAVSSTIRLPGTPISCVVIVAMN